MLFLTSILFWLSICNAQAETSQSLQSVLSLKSDRARIEFGSQGDVKVMRSGDHKITIAADVEVTGTLKVNGILLSKMIGDAIIAAKSATTTTVPTTTTTVTTTTTPTTTTTVTTTTTTVKKCTTPYTTSTDSTACTVEIAASMAYLSALSDKTEEKLRSMTKGESFNIYTNRKDADFGPGKKDLSGTNKLKLLAPAFMQLTGLQEFNLGNFKIDDDGIKVLVPVIKKLTNVEMLGFYSNQLTDEGVKALVPVLSKKLVNLHLARNQITDAGVSALIPALKTLTNLLYLHLNGNQITNAGATELLPVLKSMTQLKQLYIYNNKFSEDMKTKIKSSLPHIPSFYLKVFCCEEPCPNAGCPA